MRRALLALLLAGCAFAPVYLEFQAALPMDESAGLGVGDDGFVAAGTDVRAKSDAFEVTAWTEDGRERWRVADPVEDGSHERAQGVVALPGGDWLVYGADGTGVRGLRVDADGAVKWHDRLGTGQFVRAAAVDASGRLALAGQVYAGDGTGETRLWAAVFDVGDTAITLRGEDHWDSPRSAEARAVVATAGGFLVGGYVTVDGGERPVLFDLGADGRLDATNRAPSPDTPGRVAALARLDDGRLLMAAEEDARAAVGVLDLDGPWHPTTFCVGGAHLTRPQSVAADGGRALVAGSDAYDSGRLWLAAVTPGGGVEWVRTFDPQTLYGADRAAVAVGPSGGVAVAATLCGQLRDGRCAGDLQGNHPFLWHLDPDGAPYGTPAETDCP